ncbi:MAG: hypothetical protein A2306_11840 [Omnitrophica WOR_2 bacterium RIFOXYB2_FULL_38_16]|jgi:hypothetical protein|nr:MAG: hypothetical protein A2Y06_05575 [Omnitrophica WOR_2 bacterium GWA2_37_7]OGX47304.1 MAG: hypothetical protein A2243_01790 [Omnitrophica WOR_2 bacterium RIFOXYA2_FULL_38_17]OGX53172.1 MAG: hypothetical protein A2267_02565 [Omnitrophica WOR_2 bacterium RIFOXYA12_FULL_38_10]OGX58323.1 MAG: hypothetical protein A2306_11840 [Omnitrophica WOR_2 bacterium RIFOXYB2_FULL_38_16]OGX59695.1 MAG: hypothetical protein A2447_09015 [Omnitrophica WOR_2 bacterium RIFOXYC2_FULL_38_12]HBG61354.1 hypotheti
MDKKTKDLLAFGYGLALIIPFIIILRSMKYSMSFSSFFIVFAAGLVFLLYVVTRIINLKPSINIWILYPQFCVLTFEIIHGAGFVSTFLLTLSAIILILTIHKPDSLEPLLAVWMKGAHFIGSVITNAILIIFFYCVLSPVGLIFRLIKKDLLDRRIDHKADSYWNIEKEIKFNKEHCLRQF